jgi:tetratricopeptide (TPR) repeat protein
MIKQHKKSLKYLFLINTLLFLTISICHYPAMAQVSADSLAILLNEAYAIMQTNPDRSEQLFEQALKISPNDLALHRQLGYLYSEHNKSEQALIEFKHAEAIQPSDTIKLQMAFILVSLGREDEAVTALRELSGSRDENIKKSADAQLATISSPVDEVSPKPSNWYSRIYAAPYSDTRWNTIFYNLDAEHGYYFDRNKMFFSYGFLSFSTDSKSKFGEVPLIFSDNAVIGGVGLGVKPLTGLELRSQFGIAYDLVQQDSGVARWREDFRALVIYGNGIYPNFEFHDNVKMTFEPLLDVYSSVGYYSRYKNVIGYLQGRAGVRVFEWTCSAADLYVRSMYIKDTEREYYNNQIDAAVGLRILPVYNWDLYIMAEYYRGLYIDKLPNHYDANLEQIVDGEKYFGGFRFFIIYDHIF